MTAAPRFALLACLALPLLAGCAAKTVFLDTADHFPVAYELKRTPGAKGAVLLLHGLGTNLDEWYTFGKALRREGWTTLALDLRGHGESIYAGKEEIRWNEMSPEGRRSSFHDVEAAVKHLKVHVPEAEQNLWIAGSSFGSSLALVYAASHPEIQGVILLSPGLLFGDISTEEAARSFQSRVLLAAAEDDFGAVREAEELFGWIPSADKKLLTRARGGHGAQMLDEAEDLKKEILEWLNQESSKTRKTISA